MTEIQEVYREDTSLRRYHTPTMSKKGVVTSKQPISEVVTLNFNKPISRAEFKKLSDSLKVMYLKHLRDTYAATGVQMAAMLGYDSTYFSSKIISALNLRTLFKTRKKQTNKQLMEWKKFLNGTQPTMPIPELKKESEPMVMLCNCSFVLKGELKISDITERIKSMVSDGTPCKISVAIDALNNQEEN